MLDIFSKITKAVDAFTEALTENVNSIKIVPLYSYGEFAYIVCQEQCTDDRICKCSIRLKQVSEFEGRVYPDKKFLIKYVFLDCNNHPIPEGETADAFKGGVILASSIDIKLRDFMNGKEEKTIVVKKGGYLMFGWGILGGILAALAIGAVVYLAVTLTISFIKKYKQKKKSKIMAAQANDFKEFIKEKIKNANTVSLDELDDDDVILAEYDEETDDLVQDIVIADKVDDKVEDLLEEGDGIVVFD